MTEQPQRGTSADRAASSPKRLALARRITVWTFGVYPLLIVLFPLLIIFDDPEPPDIPDMVGIAASVALGYLCARIMPARITRPAQVYSRDVALSIVALTVLVAAQHDNATIFFAPGLWWATVMTTSSRRARVGYTLVLAVLPAVAVLAEGDFPWSAWVLGGLLYLSSSAFMLLANGAFLLLWDILNEAFAAGDAQVRLAVTEERLRFARDLHDLIGHSLSSIAVHSELAARRAERSPGRAAEEMVSVQRMAREGLREMRLAVSGYRDVDLAGEIASVQAVLSAAGTRCTVAGDDVELPADLRALAAWVVREGATNVLRHSAARRCAITLRRDERTVIVEVDNDGVPSADGVLPPYGNGLTGLNERVSAAGGTLSARPTPGGGFLLRVLLPAGAAP